MLRSALAALDAGGAEAGAGGRDARVRVLSTLAYAEAETDGLPAGLAVLARARTVVAEVVAAGDDATALEGRVLQQTGLLLLREGRHSEAADALRRATVLLARAAASDGRRDAYLEATALLNLGVAELALARVAEARRVLTQARTVALQAGLDLLVGKAEHDLGYVDAVVGDVPSALRHYSASEAALAEVDESLLPVVRLDEARALLAVGLADEAVSRAGSACEGLADGGSRHELAGASLVLAQARLLAGDVAGSVTAAGRARDLFHDAGNVAWTALATLALLEAEVRGEDAARDEDARTARGHVEQGSRASDDHLQEAAGLAERLDRLDLPDDAARARLLAARTAARSGRVDEAAAHLDRVPLPRVTTPADLRVLHHLCRAELAAAGGLPEEVLAAAGAGLAELDRLRGGLGALDLLAGAAAHGRGLSALALSTVLRRRPPAPAEVLAWTERGRAQGYRSGAPSADPALRDRLDVARSLRASAREARLAGRPAADLEERAAAAEHEAARRGWQAAPAGSRASPPAVPGAERADAREEAVARLAHRLGRTRALVTYAESGGRLVAVVVLGGEGDARDTRVHVLGPAGPVHEDLARLLADLDALAPPGLPPALRDVVAASASRHAAALDRVLLSPLRRTAGDRSLVLVPTGALHALPWGSLPGVAGRPVVVVPSAAAWQRADDVPARLDGPVVVVRGPGLPGTAEEVGLLRGLVPDAQVLSGAGATAGAVREALDGAALVVLSAHGTHTPGNALFSRLELTDGPLFAHDVLGLARPPRAVVLAACELGRHRVRTGDEPLGFAGALLAAGVRTVVAASVRVADVAAAGLTVDLVEAALRDEGLARALADAVAVDPLRRPFVGVGAGV